MKLAVDGAPFAELLRQGAPSRFCPREPKNPVQSAPMVAGRATTQRTRLNYKRLQNRPLRLIQMPFNRKRHEHTLCSLNPLEPSCAAVESRGHPELPHRFDGGRDVAERFLSRFRFGKISLFEIDSGATFAVDAVAQDRQQ